MTDPLPSYLREIRRRALTAQTHIAPLAVFRMVFGAVMFFSVVRFVANGWVTAFYIKPGFHFTFYGFEWVRPLDATGMYIVFILMGMGSLGILLGYFYRVSTVIFLLSFTYVELLDQTYYLNHYYLVTLLAFLLLFVPAHRHFSLDVLRNPTLKQDEVPAWTISIFRLQLLLVYFLAGVAKLNAEWLLDAMPLRIWLPAGEHIPVIGPWLKAPWVAYLFSWFGAAYDLLIGFMLLNDKTRKTGFTLVVIFHLVTALLFKIGMFPYIMIGASLIFFPADFHQEIIRKLRTFFGRRPPHVVETPQVQGVASTPFISALLIAYFVIQLLMPFRYLLYPGDLYWTEEGYRFSWRVMLMEKGGTAFFLVEDPETHQKVEVPTSRYLTAFQEKMMATQPDMILQYAHFLDAEYRRQGVHDPVVTVQSYVTLNGGGSRPFIDSTVDLSRQQEGWRAKTWILPRQFQPGTAVHSSKID